MIRCPFCLEFIKEGAYVCRYCGRDIRPEYLFLYRTVLETHPELRQNSVGAKRELERVLDDYYAKYLIDEKNKLRTQEERRKEIARQEDVDARILEDKRIKAAIKRMDALLDQLKKIKDFFKSPFFIYGIVPIAILFFGVMTLWFNSEGYKQDKLAKEQERERVQFIKDGGEIKNLGIFISNELEILDLDFIEGVLRLEGKENSCDVWLKKDTRIGTCWNSGYKNDVGDEFVVIFEFFFCPDTSYLLKVRLWDILESGEVQSDGLTRLTKVPKDNDVEFFYGCGRLGQKKIF